MDETKRAPLWRRWAHLRFSIVGMLLAAPPARGELQEALRELAERAWAHPVTGRPIQFAVSTLERWYYAARGKPQDPVSALQKRERRDSGQQRVVSQRVGELLRAQYRAHKSWSYLLHHQNLAVLVEQDKTLGSMPSYSSVRRFMKAQGLRRQPRRKSRLSVGQQLALARLEEREVRSYEAEYVNELWHCDFHHGSLPVVLESGELTRAKVLGILDDRSRLACHVQWYLDEDTRSLDHGLCQAFQKRGLPGALLSDRGSAMRAAETQQGLADLGVAQSLTLAESPYQNGKQEAFWTPLEGRLMAMLEGCRDLTLDLLNRATQAWYELEYNRSIHSEIASTPLDRYLAGPNVGRSCPDSEALRLAFTRKESRSQRHSDGTLSIAGRRFEVPARFRHLRRIHLRYAEWDLSRIYLIDPRTDKVLDRIHPLDKTANADGLRRLLPRNAETEPAEPATASDEIAPLLKKLMAEYAATGLPPAYVPLPPQEASEDDPEKDQDKE